MPARLPTAVKTRKELLEKELSIQKAVDEYWATWEDDKPLSQTAIAAKHHIALSTLTARIRGRPSKLASASLQQKIRPDEEQLIVDYLEETAHRGFPDTKKRCARRANEILHMRSGIKDAKVGHHWLGRFMHRHHDRVRSYWSTTLTTVQGGSLNSAIVNDWFELLQTTITTCSIEQDCIFAMDETCCFLDRSVHKTRHIGSTGQKQQIALRNETRATATMIPIISASGKVFPPTVIFQGKILRGSSTWENPLGAV